MYYVYILTNKKHGTLYTGVTNNLKRRIWEHKNLLLRGFTEKYKLKNLVYFEQTENILGARNRERRLKRWPREWKIKIIEKQNPQWKDLFPHI